MPWPLTETTAPSLVLVAVRACGDPCLESSHLLSEGGFLSPDAVKSECWSLRGGGCFLEHEAHWRYREYGQRPLEGELGFGSQSNTCGSS